MVFIYKGPGEIDMVL